MSAGSDFPPHYAPVKFADLPYWRDDDTSAALRAFIQSAVRVIDRGTQVPPSWGGLALDMAAACRAALAREGHSFGRSEARAFFEHFFEPHRVIDDGQDGLLTAYFEPVLHGALSRTEHFHVPLYRRPADLVTVVAEDLRGRAGKELTHMRRRLDGGLEPFPVRADIETGALEGRGLELCWLADPVDAFFLHVQGSGVIRLAEGGRIRLTYDGKNGHPYMSVGRHLIARGEMDARAMSLERLAAYLRAHRVRGREVMRVNESFVFFRAMTASEGNSARGVLDAPLSAGRSLAIDAAVHPLGVPVYVDAPTLRHVRRRQPFRRLMVAQDVGSAIRGRQRGDAFLGSGRRAGEIAGAVKHACRFFVLLPRRRRG